MSDYKYTSYDLTSTIAEVGEIGINDVVMLNGNNIMTAINQDYKGINPIPSFDVAKGISASTSSDVADIRKGYFNLSSDNTISGTNTYLSAQTFVSANIADAAIGVSRLGDSTISNASINKLSAAQASAIQVVVDQSFLSSTTISNASISAEDVDYSKTKDLSVTGSLSTDFNIIINTKQDFLSALHSTDQIKYINNVYRMVDEIIVETGIKDDSSMPAYSGLYAAEWEDLVNVYIKDGIITVKADELNIHEGDIISQFKSNPDPDVNETVDVLQAILNRLRIVPYSLDTKIRSIENSIDVLEVNLTDRTEELEGKQQTDSNDITAIKSKIDNANCSYTLDSAGKLSVITSVKQLSCKVEVSAKTLTSADVEGLSNYVDSQDQNVKEYVGNTYLPLSGGEINGSLTVDNDIKVNGSISNIKVGSSDLCTLMNNEIALSTQNSSRNISIELSNAFDFRYNPATNMISASVAGKTLAFSANKFTEARMLDSANIIYVSGKPALQLKFKTDTASEFTIVSVDLSEIMPLYNGNDGIDIEYSSGKYQVSADSTICRRSDISSLNASNTLTTGYILTSLSQSAGKLSYGTTELSISHVTGLEDYPQVRSFSGSLSGNTGVISSLSNTVKTTIQNLDVTSQSFYGTGSDAGKIKVLTSLSQDDGKISYETQLLAYDQISGLTSKLDTKLDNNTDAELTGNLSVYGNIYASKGLNVISSFTAIGGKVESNGANGGVAIGRDAVAKDEESFVWSGTDEEYSTYNSHGQHTFNINPENGLSGIYIGNNNFHDTLSSISAEATSKADVKTKALFSGIKDALSTAGIFGKRLEEITLANVISSIYELGQLVTSISGDFN